MLLYGRLNYDAPTKWDLRRDEWLDTQAVHVYFVMGIDSVLHVYSASAVLKIAFLLRLCVYCKVLLFIMQLYSI